MLYFQTVNGDFKKFVGDKALLRTLLQGGGYVGPDAQVQLFRPSKAKARAGQYNLQLGQARYLDPTTLRFKKATSPPSNIPSGTPPVVLRMPVAVPNPVQQQPVQQQQLVQQQQPVQQQPAVSPIPVPKSTRYGITRDVLRDLIKRAKSGNWTQVQSVHELLKLWLNDPASSLGSGSPGRCQATAVMKDVLLKRFSDGAIHRYASQHWTKNESILIRDFVAFLLQNPDIGKRNVYHEYVDFVVVVLRLEVYEFPNYATANSDISRALVPRLETMVGWWVSKRVAEDPFLSRMSEAIPTCQYEIETGEGRYFDLGWPNFGGVLEVQEDADNHEDNDNDRVKMGLAIVHQLWLLHFHEAEYKEGPDKYLTKFWDQLRDHLVSAALATISRARVRYLKSRFLEDLDVRARTAGSSSLRTRLLTMKNCIQRPQDKANQSVSIFDLVMDWKERECNVLAKSLKARTGKSIRPPLIIPVADAVAIGCYASTDEFLRVAKANGPVVVRGKQSFIDWRTLVLSVSSLNQGSAGEGGELMEYLVTTQYVAEEMLLRVTGHYERRMAAVTHDAILRAAGHLIKKSARRDQVAEKQRRRQHQRITCRKNTIATQLRLALDAAESEIATYPALSGTQVTEHLRAAVEARILTMTTPKNGLTLRRIKGQSIIEEHATFPIVFTDDPSDALSVDELRDVCRVWNVDSNFAKIAIQILPPVWISPSPKKELRRVKVATATTIESEEEETEEDAGTQDENSDDDYF